MVTLKGDNIVPEFLQILEDYVGPHIRGRIDEAVTV